MVPVPPQPEPCRCRCPIQCRESVLVRGERFSEPLSSTLIFNKIEQAVVISPIADDPFFDLPRLRWGGTHLDNPRYGLAHLTFVLYSLNIAARKEKPVRIALALTVYSGRARPFTLFA